MTLTSRAFHNDQLGPWYEKICQLTNKEMALPMNTGAEAVETAVKQQDAGAMTSRESKTIAQKLLRALETSMAER